MDIIIAQNAGFCFGVKEALKRTMEAVKLNKNKRIYTYGPLIHNKQVINELKKIGVESTDSLEKAKNSLVVVRSHGVPLDIYKKSKELNIEIVDATCPFVRKVQKIANEYYKKGYKIIIIGNQNHPEVIGINGWCENSAAIVESVKEAEELPVYDKVCIVAQTTLTLESWNIITEKLKSKANEFRAFNTICLATKERQDSCAQVAKQVDIMIVIGGRHSSNTQKLYEISKLYCDRTIHIETAEELSLSDLEECKIVGVTAGASTPDWIINKVIKKIEEKK